MFVEVVLDVCVGFFEVDFGVGEMVVGCDEGAGVEVFGGDFLVEILANDVGGKAFAETGDEVEGAVGKFAEEFDALEELGEFVEGFLDFCFDGFWIFD